MRVLLTLMALLWLPVTVYSKPIDLTADEMTAETFNPAKLLTTANKLIALGNEDCYLSLTMYAPATQPRWQYKRDNYITWLCLLVYETKTPGSLKIPIFGAPDFPFPIQTSEWPVFPLAFSDKTPFLLVSGYILGGLALPGSYYVDEYHKNGIFRTRPYPIPTKAEAQKSLDNLLTSQKWNDLHWDHPEFWKSRKIKFLQEQIDRIP